MHEREQCFCKFFVNAWDFQYSEEILSWSTSWIFWEWLMLIHPLWLVLKTKCEESQQNGQISGKVDNFN
jgi:hypothetical protein